MTKQQEMFKFTGSDARRLDIEPRRFFVDYRGNIEILNSRGDVIYGELEHDIVDDIDFWDPSDMEESWMTDFLSGVELGYDVLCYYRGNPDSILIPRYNGYIEYYSEKIFETKVESGNWYQYTEYAEEVIADLPKWYYWVAGNPDFDIKIKYG